MIATKNLSYSYPGGESFVFPDIECKGEELLLVLGKSGVGKTTLLHLLGGLITTSKGEIQIGNQIIQQLSGKKMDTFRGKNIGIIFQNNHFVQALNVIENLELAQTLAGNPENRKMIMELLERLHIGHKTYSEIHHLSQGERQRVAIARAMVNHPAVILADEPTSALDDNNTFEVVNLLHEQARQVGSALIIVTHDTRLKEIIPNQIILH
ncbi:MAG: ATP-binding cassette domain-containing protein [Saprospiraceae bacterium]|nr:ATP-binding cassette domain-containing protein [Saprospiraceae bacterium]MBK8078961.1 ATP-binding cassette domain-containing protein [Saprospiraceae bacterium]